MDYRISFQAYLLRAGKRDVRKYVNNSFMHWRENQKFTFYGRPGASQECARDCSSFFCNQVNGAKPLIWIEPNRI